MNADIFWVIALFLIAVAIIAQIIIDKRKKK